MVMQVYRAADQSVETNKPVELTTTEIPALAATST
jgi:hypothetical protein